MVKLLLQNGSNFNALDKNGWKAINFGKFFLKNINWCV